MSDSWVCIHQGFLPERWSLETFPWPRQPGVNRKRMRTFAELDFVAKHENLVLVGPTGVGRTGLLALIDDGYRSRFISNGGLERLYLDSISDLFTKAKP